MTAVYDSAGYTPISDCPYRVLARKIRDNLKSLLPLSHMAFNDTRACLHAIWSEPEGSSHSGNIVCRGVAGGVASITLPSAALHHDQSEKHLKPSAIEHSMSAYSSAWHLEIAHVDKVDDLTREKLREWQMRRLEIKDRIQSHPEQTLELSRVLDLMDDEHAEILSRSELVRTVDVAPKLAMAGDDALLPLEAAYKLELNVSAHNAEDLRRLLDLAVYELQQRIETSKTFAGSDKRRHPGNMSGSLGDYHFELSIEGE